MVLFDPISRIRMSGCGGRRRRLDAYAVMRRLGRGNCNKADRQSQQVREPRGGLREPNTSGIRTREK